jgi:eukaryotic-like serine/threonine-protein kinase
MAQRSDALDHPNFEGTIIGGKYRVSRLIGTGGMGTVWEGFHSALNTRVAIKFIKPQYAEHKEARARFEIEARAAAQLQSKHAVQVYDYGVTDGGLPYIVMEFLEGESLSEAIIRRGALPGAEVAQIMEQAARALDKAHSTGVVHRDLKPDNIFLAKPDEPSKEGELPYTVKLVDFGIAKIFEEPQVDDKGRQMGGPTREGTVIGTPNFMAPEQLTVGGAPGPLTDIWSLGACTFAAMTARIPFEGDVLGDIVLKVCVAPVPIPSKVNPAVPQGFDAWFARACSRDPNKRFQSAGELAEALNGVCGRSKLRVATLEEDQVQYVMRADPSQAELPDDLPTGGMSPKTAMLAGLVLGVAVMVGVVGFLAWRQKQMDDQTPVPALSTAPLAPSAPSAPSATAAPGESASAAPSAAASLATSASSPTPSPSAAPSASASAVPSASSSAGQRSKNGK